MKTFVMIFFREPDLNHWRYRYTSTTLNEQCGKTRSLLSPKLIREINSVTSLLTASSGSRKAKFFSSVPKAQMCSFKNILVFQEFFAIRNSVRIFCTKYCFWGSFKCWKFLPILWVTTWVFGTYLKINQKEIEVARKAS